MPAHKFDQPLLLWGEVGTIETLVRIFVHHEETHAREIKRLTLTQRTGAN